MRTFDNRIENRLKLTIVRNESDIENGYLTYTDPYSHEWDLPGKSEFPDAGQSVVSICVGYWPQLSQHK